MKQAALQEILSEIDIFIESSREFIESQRSRFQELGILDIRYVNNAKSDLLVNLSVESFIEFVFHGMTEKHAVSLCISPENVRVYSYAEVVTDEGEQLWQYEITETVGKSLSDISNLGFYTVARQDIVDQFQEDWFPTQEDLTKFKAAQHSKGEHT